MYQIISAPTAISPTNPPMMAANRTKTLVFFFFARRLRGTLSFRRAFLPPPLPPLGDRAGRAGLAGGSSGSGAANWLPHRGHSIGVSGSGASSSRSLALHSGQRMSNAMGSGPLGGRVGRTDRSGRSFDVIGSAGPPTRPDPGLTPPAGGVTLNL